MDLTSIVTKTLLLIILLADVCDTTTAETGNGKGRKNRKNKKNRNKNRNGNERAKDPQLGPHMNDKAKDITISCKLTCIYFLSTVS